MAAVTEGNAVKTDLFNTIKELATGKPCLAVIISGIALGTVACSKGSDSLRSLIPPTGVAAAVQIDLPSDSQQAQVAATVYKDAVAQPLVGGDVLQARTDQSVATLHSVSNLSGHYTGTLFVDHADTPVDVAVNYDQEASAEDRWFASDELLVNPGPGSLVGYAVDGMRFPPVIAFESPAEGTRYVTRADTVTVNWTPVNEGDQARLTAAVACVAGSKTYRYGLAFNIGIEGEDAAAAGSYSLTIEDLVNVAPVVATLDNVVEYISLLITASFLGLEPKTLLANEDLVTQPSEVKRCDIDLTLFREHSNTLPAAFSGGYAITSRSDTIRIAYDPE